MHALAFALDATPSGATATTGSPVNLHAYDNQGRHTGLNASGDVEAEIPGTYLYIPSENDKELIVILTSEDITFVVEATDEGEFNLSINTYDRDTSAEVVLEYKNVIITNTTVATLEITDTNPDFILQIDQDGDGTVDDTTVPDTTTTSEGYENPETDSDQDGTADSLDNCLNDWNPEQEDCNSDRVGDACDINSFNLTLTPGWNLISIPLIPEDNSLTSIMSGCDYNRVWSFKDSSWKSTDTGLTEMDIYRGYWVDRLGFSDNCTITVEGEEPDSTTINVSSGWNLVGYPSLTPKQISTFINESLYNRIWEFNQGWKSTDTGLVNMAPGKGYWIDGKSEGSYVVD